MNMRRETARREEERVSNERIPSRVDQFPIVVLENVNHAVPLMEPQGPQGPQIPPMHQDPQVPFLEWDMTNDFMRMYSLAFHGTKVDENPQSFIYEIFKVSLAGTNGYFACASKNNKMRECPKIKEKGKDINQAPQGGLDPIAPKKNPPYGMGARREN
ncbi:hypothetical protein EJD97_022454 [Solanum chilense]|uniref:Uncharacterized protein n=1 Tax=Solanum chilense TaxID=4083 RepID=A0A6N2AVN9_SOLCI|nr:hypothetical protein EJD97_022454 [Solanum chilense]